MKEAHCDALEMILEFPLEEINQDAFLQAAKIDREEFTDEDGDLVAGIDFGARDEATDYHAHMRVVFYKDGRGRVDVSYHASKAETIDKEPPYVEDCVQWLGSFLKNDKLKAHIHATFLFDDSYSPSIGLPFPLITTDKTLAGTLVTGVSLVSPKESGSEMAILQSVGDETYLALSTTTEISLTDFDLTTQFRKLSVSTNSYVKKHRTADENNSAHKGKE
jgi:hypothetical protein